VAHITHCWPNFILICISKIYSINNSTGQSRSSEANIRSAGQNTFPSFMEIDISFSCSQKPATGPYPESNKSSIHSRVYLGSILIFSFHLRLDLPRYSDKYIYIYIYACISHLALHTPAISSPSNRVP